MERLSGWRFQPIRPRRAGSARRRRAGAERSFRDAIRPKLLAKYQSKLSEYNLYRNAQSNAVKAFKDIDAAIIQNFR
ncbi:type III secretion system needle complex protein PrgI [Chromobacterium violaceum]|uniref:Type III secretion system needle complex protein PrgI n=1 Tax=Chromobacterium violaceum TaxID=536 RepID=A0A447TDS6_CHRVL|nr:type III secretion system needle complex protein PrgI [Chromobacterium violaceum]